MSILSSSVFIIRGYCRTNRTNEFNLFIAVQAENFVSVLIATTSLLLLRLILTQGNGFELD